MAIDQIIVRGGSEHIPQMGDFFLRQMDDFFTEGLCFDTSLGRGKGERGVGAPPFSAKGQSPLK